MKEAAIKEAAIRENRTVPQEIETLAIECLGRRIRDQKRAQFKKEIGQLEEDWEDKIDLDHIIECIGKGQKV